MMRRAAVAFARKPLVAAMSPAMRLAAARAPTVPRRYLSSTAASELTEEKEVMNQMDNPSPPEGWKVEYTSGKAYFRMSKNVNGAELMVDCLFDGHKGEEGTSFTVYVTRNGITADFTVSFSEQSSELLITDATTFESKEIATNLTPEAEFEREQRYQGPNLEDLSETEIPGKLKEFLGTFGVNEELGLFVHKKVQVFEQMAYMKFLEDVQKLAA